MLAGKVALITGGGHGIGKAVVMALAAEGAAVAITGRNTARLDETQAQIEAAGGRAEAFVCDVGDPKSVRAAFEETRATLGPIDILVNNAGLTASVKFQETPDDLWEEIIRINAGGTFYCCKAALPDMIERHWGRIVNIASMAGLGGLAYSAAYSASKHAQLGLTRSLALEVARYNIAVNAICPTWVDTDMYAAAADALVQKTGRTTEEARADLLKLSGQTSVIAVEAVAAEVMKLVLLPDAGTTGQAISMF